jgi:hypothetical protein
MIFFLRTRRNRHPLDRYLASWGRSLTRVVQPLEYDHLLRTRGFVPGIYFFADLEFLDDGQRARAAGVWDALYAMGPEVLLFNHPHRSLLRYDLLRKLHREQVNDFTVYRPDEDLGALQYPAFARLEDDHKGARSRLIEGPGGLSEALAEVRASSDQRWLITEFCDTSDGDGIFRKYSAFLINGQVIPRYVFFSRAWIQKAPDLVNDELREEERLYITTNPHEEQVRRVFQLANLEYGRIDYGMRDGRIQVWEINTNPMILSLDSNKQRDRIDVHELFSRRFERALRELAATRPGRLRDNYPGQRLSASVRIFCERPRVRTVVHWVKQSRYRVTALIPRPGRRGASPAASDRAYQAPGSDRAER